MQHTYAKKAPIDKKPPRLVLCRECEYCFGGYCHVTLPPWQPVSIISGGCPYGRKELGK